MERKERRSPSYSRYQPDGKDSESHSRTQEHKETHRHHHEKRKSRSRSRSREKERHHHYKKSRSNARSGEDQFTKKLEMLREETIKRKTERRQDQEPKQIERKQYKINNSVLSLIIKDNIKVNEKMDKVCVGKLTINRKK